VRQHRRIRAEASVRQQSRHQTQAEAAAGPGEPCQSPHLGQHPAE